MAFARIIHFLKLDGRGGARDILSETSADAAKAQAPEMTGQQLDLSAGEWVWLHLQLEKEEEEPDEKLPIFPELDPWIVSALLAEETRPRAVEHAGGVLMTLRGVNTNTQDSPEDMVSIRLWVEAGRVISVRKRRLWAVADIEAALKRQEGPATPADFMCRLAGKLSHRMEDFLADLGEMADESEEKILNNDTDAFLEEITSLRRKVIAFKRYLAPQKEAINSLRHMQIDWIEDVHKKLLQEVNNDLLRQLEDLEALRERMQVIKEEAAAKAANQMNKNMYLLSLMAAIFLPLGFLTGLFGINVGGIPGADSVGAFAVFSGALFVGLLLQLLIFKLLKWF